MSDIPYSDTWTSDRSNIERLLYQEIQGELLPHIVYTTKPLDGVHHFYIIASSSGKEFTRDEIRDLEKKQFSASLTLTPIGPEIDLIHTNEKEDNTSFAGGKYSTHSLTALPLDGNIEFYPKEKRRVVKSDEMKKWDGLPVVVKSASWEPTGIVNLETHVNIETRNKYLDMKKIAEINPPGYTPVNIDWWSTQFFHGELGEYVSWYKDYLEKNVLVEGRILNDNEKFFVVRKTKSSFGLQSLPTTILLKKRMSWNNVRILAVVAREDYQSQMSDVRPDIIAPVKINTRPSKKESHIFFNGGFVSGGMTLLAWNGIPVITTLYDDSESRLDNRLYMPFDDISILEVREKYIKSAKDSRVFALQEKGKNLLDAIKRGYVERVNEMISPPHNVLFDAGVAAMILFEASIPSLQYIRDNFFMRFLMLADVFNEHIKDVLKETSDEARVVILNEIFARLLSMKIKKEVHINSDTIIALFSLILDVLDIDLAVNLLVFLKFYINDDGKLATRLLEAANQRFDKTDMATFEFVIRFFERPIWEKFQDWNVKYFFGRMAAAPPGFIAAAYASQKKLPLRLLEVCIFSVEIPFPDEEIKKWDSTRNPRKLQETIWELLKYARFLDFKYGHEELLDDFKFNRQTMSPKNLNQLVMNAIYFISNNRCEIVNDILDTVDQELVAQTLISFAPYWVHRDDADEQEKKLGERIAAARSSM